MKVEKVRIQNFQCIRDSGEILIDDHITVLVGENESGKSAILKALSYFNQGENFQDVDVSTMSYIRPRLDSGEISRDSIDMVVIWVALSEKDKRALMLPEQLMTVSIFKIVKTLDNQYKIFTGNDILISKALLQIKTLDIIAVLEDLKTKVQNVYSGQVKRKGFFDQFVFLQRQEDEELKDNLVLFSISAKDIWNDVKAGDWLQVTKIAEDFFGRKNRRALNAGMKFDIEKHLSDFINAVKSNDLDTHKAFIRFNDALKDLQTNHPLRDYVTDDIIAKLEDLCTVPPATYNFPSIEKGILRQIPNFVYLPSIEKISDSISLDKLVSGNLDESDTLLATLLRVAGLRPEIAVKKDQAERMKNLKEKSEIISDHLRKHWFKNDVIVDFDFLNQDRNVGIAIDSDGSFDPPSRRSQGFSSYVSLFAKLAQLAVRENIVVLLDDPALYLHPVAQKKIITLLESQKYQIVLATHLPFMIHPEYLERIRVARRTPAGTQIEHDWAKVEQSLLPVWGSIFGSFTGRIWLLVEGKKDWEYYSALNQACKKSDHEHFSGDIVMVPAGGDQLPYVANALNTRGIFFVAILDGDRPGQKNKKKIIEMCDIDPQRIVTLNEIGLSEPNPEVEDIFSQEFKTNHNVNSKEALSHAVQEAEKCKEEFDNETLNSFVKIVSLINKSLIKFR